MATHDYVIANQSGAAFRTDLNNALAAIVSNNSNSSQPGTRYAYQWWADTSAGVMKIRNSANDGWIELFQLDGTLTLEDGSNSAPALAFRDDLDTGIYSDAANEFNVATGGVERFSCSASAFVVNQTGADVDFRIEGDTAVNLFYVDAGNNKVGINTNAPDGLLHAHSGSAGTVTAASDANELVLESTANVGMSFLTGNSSLARIKFGDPDDTGVGAIIYSHASNFLSFKTAGNEAARFDSSKHLLVGLTTALSSQNGSVQAAGPVIAKSFINAHTSNAAIVQYQSNGFILRSYGASSGTGYIQFNISGGGDATDTEAMRIDAAGNVHIANSGFSATTSSDDLTVGNLSGDHGITIFSGTDSGGFICFGDTNTTGVGSRDGVIRYQQSDSSMRFATNGNNERMRLTDIGTMQVSNMGSFAATNPTFHDFSADSANDLILRLRNTSSTNPYGLRINFDNAAPNDSTRYFIYCVDNVGTKFQVNTNGGIQNFQSNDSNLCDEREKKNIVSLDTKWDKVKSWELKKFHYNEDADTDDLRYGVIAQQIEQHCPEVLTPWIKQRAEDAVLDEDGNVVKEAVTEIARKGVKEQQMMWIAIKALQEAQTRIETLETKVAALESA